MAWIELHQSLWTHRKTLRLAAELDILPIYAAGHMAHFWCWALDNVPDGNLTDIPPMVIATAASWPGDANVFFQAVVTAGYFDQDEGNTFIHDWYDYAGKLIEQREAERERSRKRREEMKQNRNLKKESGQPPNDHRSTVGTVPNLTVTNQDIRSSAASKLHSTANTPGEDEAAVAEQKNAAWDKVQARFAEITGRIIPSPIDARDINEALELADGRDDLVITVMDAVARRYKPKTEGDKINSFGYFLQPLRETIECLKARASPSAVPAKRARSGTMIGEIVSGLPPDLRGEKFGEPEDDLNRFITPACPSTG